MQFYLENISYWSRIFVWKTSVTGHIHLSISKTLFTGHTYVTNLTSPNKTTIKIKSRTSEEPKLLFTLTHNFINAIKNICMIRKIAQAVCGIENIGTLWSKFHRFQ
jgi:hypothetical protein